MAKFSALVRRFLFFYRAEYDDGRLTALGLWLLRGNGAGRKGQLLLCATLGSPANAGKVQAGAAGGEEYLMVRRVRQILALSLQRLQRSANLPAGDVHALDCGVLLTLTDKNLFSANAALHRSFLDTLLQHGLMNVVGLHLQRCLNAMRAHSAPTPYQPAEENLQLLLITLAVNVLALSDEVGPASHEAAAGDAEPDAASAPAPATTSQAAAVEQFSRHILTIRDVLRPGALSPKGRLVLLGAPAASGGSASGVNARRVWVACLSALSRGNGALSHKLCREESLEAVSFLLGNLAELSLSCLPLSSAHVRGLFAICASRLLSHVRQSKHARLEAGDDVPMDDAGDDMQIETEHTERAVETAAGVTWVTETKSRVLSSATSHLPPALHAVRQHVQALCRHEYIVSLLDVVQAAPNEPGGASAVGSTCGLVLHLLEFIPEARTSVLNALAFKPAVLTMLWRVLVDSLPRPASSPGKGPHGAGMGAGAAGEHRHVAVAAGALDKLQQESLLSMFSMVYEYFLMTADNDDLYIRQYPFQLDEVREMVETLKLIIYPMYAARVGSHAATPAVAAAAAAAGGGDRVMAGGEEDSHAGNLLGDVAAGGAGERLPLTESAKKLRTMGTKLLNRLYERNCYREFMPAVRVLTPARARTRARWGAVGGERGRRGRRGRRGG